MSGGLQHAGDDAPALCAFCTREAAGPCASCRRLVCGECCTLTEGGAKVWAVCLDCDRRKGRSLAGAWSSFGGFLVAILVTLAAAVGLLAWCAR